MIIAMVLVVFNMVPTSNVELSWWYYVYIKQVCCVPSFSHFPQSSLSLFERERAREIKVHWPSFHARTHGKVELSVKRGSWFVTSLDWFVINNNISKMKKWSYVISVFLGQLHRLIPSKIWSAFKNCLFQIVNFHTLGIKLCN